MPKVMVEFPEEIVEAMKLPPGEVPMRLKRELAVRLYEKKLLGFGKARQLAGMTKWEFQQLLGEQGVPRSYDLEELERDLKTLEERDFPRF